MHAKSPNHIRLFAIPGTAAPQTPVSTAFSRQEYWSGLPFPTPGDLPNPELEPKSLALAGRFYNTEPPGKLLTYLGLAKGFDRVFL